jgi:hypothetical protein
VPPRYTEQEARNAIAASSNWTEALRKLGRCPSGGAQPVLKKWAAIWEIPSDHFDPNIARRIASARRGRPLEELLTEHSTLTRGALKQRLYDAGLKDRSCELCGQGETWQGRRMSLILDHINGVRDDNRLDNLRILCANCNATLDTHCGKLTRIPIPEQTCAGCGESFTPNRTAQRYCSAGCAARHMDRTVMAERLRRAERPPVDLLTAEVARDGYEAIGRKYGVSGTAIRSWFLAYGVEPPRRRRDRQLTDAQAVAALELLASGLSQRALANRLGATVSAIGDLKRGRTYRHIERPAPLAA